MCHVSCSCQLAEGFACVSVYVLCGLVGAFCSLALLLVGGVLCSSRLSFTLLKAIKTLVTAHPEPRTGARCGWLTGVCR